MSLTIQHAQPKIIIIADAYVDEDQISVTSEGDFYEIELGTTQVLRGATPTFMPVFKEETPSNGDGLYWSTANGQFEAAAPPAGGGGSLPDKTGHEGQYLRVQAGEASEDWEDIAQIHGRTILNSVTPIVGHVLKYDGSDWTYGFISAADLPTSSGFILSDGTEPMGASLDMDSNGLVNVASINGLDVGDAYYIETAEIDTTALATADLLSYNGLSSKWENTYSVGQFLFKDGSVAMTGDLDLGGNDLTNTGVVSATQLQGATISSATPVSNRFLRYNSSNEWAPDIVTIPRLDDVQDTAWSDEQLIVYDSGDSRFEPRSLHLDTEPDFFPIGVWIDVDGAGYNTRRQLTGGSIQDPGVATERWRLTFRVPSEWDSSTDYTIRIHYFQQSSGTGNIRWAYRLGYTAEAGEAVATNSVTLMTRAAPGTQYETDYFDITVSSGSITAGDYITFEIARNNDANDTYSGTASLLGATMKLTRQAYA